MQQVMDTIKQRRSIRKYIAKQVEEAALQQILEAALYAPSAFNNQRATIVVCQDKKINQIMGKLNRYFQFGNIDPACVAMEVSCEQPSILDDIELMDGFYGAPTVCYIFACPGLYANEDGAMVASSMMQMATACGVASCYVGRAKDEFMTDYGKMIRKKWNVDPTLVAVGHVLLGYIDGKAPSIKDVDFKRIVRV